MRDQIVLKFIIYLVSILQIVTFRRLNMRVGDYGAKWRPAYMQIFDDEVYCLYCT